MPDVSTQTVTAASAEPNEPHLPAGTLLANRYAILRVLGSGGSAVVYAAHDRELKRDIALKLLRPGRADSTSIERLRREVALTREISSAHLIRIFDIGQSESGAFLTMELCETATLRSRIAAGPVAIEEAIRYTDNILEALEMMHARGIVHRDVKPNRPLLPLILRNRDGHVARALVAMLIESMNP